jgi:hypothetical protein
MHEGRLTGILDRPQFSEEAVMRLATGTEQGHKEAQNAQKGRIELI